MIFKISNPTEPMVILQGFGVNGEYYRSHGINIKGHNGFDLRTSHGQPLYANHDGIGLYQVDAKGGHGVVIITNETYDYLDGQVYFKTIWWHLCDPIREPQFKSPLADKGAMQVKKGDLIGYADSTGFSTMDHLHFAVKPVLKGENIYTWGPVERDNGYTGCIDPTPYLDMSYSTEDLIKKRDGLIRQAISLAQQLLQRLLKQQNG